MKFINVDGMVFIGPGSEWFWTAFSDPTQVPYGAASYVIDFWEDTAALVRAGHLDRRLLHMTIGNGCRRWWAILAPFVYRLRAETGNSRGAEHFEWLAGVMAELDRRGRDATQYDPETIARGLNDLIRNQTDRLRTAEELRAIVVRPMAPMAPAPPLAVASMES